MKAGHQLAGTTAGLPMSLQYNDIPIDQALAALAVQLQELAARIYPISDIDCTISCDLQSGKACLRFRACS
ncbi:MULTISPECIES: hypothetical protein [unclassified Sinorhizobium]|uniref:hypothetical protein n=1 Tax=unclassified Sinorhizobium TaxID=2613772 RepID=UPI0024C31C8F|nr:MULTISPECIES: hypothetical protein [unclassified Sinorhizobium]MDK1376152.1 hypothetical protein [Sinorhizobium sp. 6-70]MDK1480311.1 hypothetical protein [Sinorhizobium sp. 6-117]